MSNSRTGSEVSHRAGGNDTRRLTPRMCAYKVRTYITTLYPDANVSVIVDMDDIERITGDDAARALIIWEEGPFEWAMDYTGGDDPWRWQHDIRTCYAECTNGFTLALYPVGWGL